MSENEIVSTMSIPETPLFEESRIIEHYQAIKEIIGEDRRLRKCFIEYLENDGFRCNEVKSYNEGIDDLLKRIVDNIGDLKIKRMLRS